MNKRGGKMAAETRSRGNGPVNAREFLRLMPDQAHARNKSLRRFGCVKYFQRETVRYRLRFASSLKRGGPAPFILIGYGGPRTFHLERQLRPAVPRIWTESAGPFRGCGGTRTRSRDAFVRARPSVTRNSFKRRVPDPRKAPR